MSDNLTHQDLMEAVPLSMPGAVRLVDALRAALAVAEQRLANAAMQADHDAGVIADLGAQVEALTTQVPPAEVVEAMRTVCELGAYPTVRWFDAQKIAVAWLDSQPEGERNDD